MKQMWRDIQLRLQGGEHCKAEGADEQGTIELAGWRGWRLAVVILGQAMKNINDQIRVVG